MNDDNINNAPTTLTTTMYERELSVQEQSTMDRKKRQAEKRKKMEGGTRKKERRGFRDTNSTVMEVSPPGRDLVQDQSRMEKQEEK